MRCSPTDPVLYLLEPRDIDGDKLPGQIRRYRPQLDTTLAWAHAYLCQPHAELGREGPVCPYTQRSLDRALLWLTVQPGHKPTTEQACGVVMRYRDWFLELEPLTGNAAQYKAILILFPDVKAPTIIDTIQAALKPRFVASGLMIGQFHAECAEPALWNPQFRPLRSPVPLLAIRQMVPTDFPFLKHDPDSLSMYLHRFGDAVPARLRDAVREAAVEIGLEHPTGGGL